MAKGVTTTTAKWLLAKQRRCCECGEATSLEIHHRVFRSEGQKNLSDFLVSRLSDYATTYNTVITPWGIHSIQNLVVLCAKHHQELHNTGNGYLRLKYRESFTCPITGFNKPFIKIKTLY